VTEPQSKPSASAPPDRLSSNPKSPFYDQAVLDRDVGIRFNGAEKTNVEEYCVSEGWVRLSAGNAKDRYGNAMTVKLKGKVEPYFRG
jgi:lipoprotein-anchoring transpeptidase ErfK/SrfK